MSSSTEATFDPERYLTLARDLAKSDDESSLRTAVGRAYYALFLTARDRTHITDPENVHYTVRKAVEHQIGRSIGSQLNDMKVLRTIADYEMKPEDPDYHDWRANWDRQEAIAIRLLPHIRKLRP